MIIKLQNKFKQFMLHQEIWISRATDKKKLSDFFDKVKPIKTNHELIRVGQNSDGGYLIPDDITGIDACFSPGVSAVADFENDLTKKGIKCFLADFSVECSPIKNSLFDFEKKFLGSIDNDRYMTLENWVREKAPEKSEFILQMDIEGGEYQVIFDTSAEMLKKFRILVIEFHDLDNLYSPMGYELISSSFLKLLKYFEVVHIHPNNASQPFEKDDFIIPPTMEFTFLRKDRINHRSKNITFPHCLDIANMSSKPDFVLPKCWY